MSIELNSSWEPFAFTKEIDKKKSIIHPLKPKFNVLRTFEVQNKLSTFLYCSFYGIHFKQPHFFCQSQECIKCFKENVFSIVFRLRRACAFSSCLLFLRPFVWSVRVHFSFHFTIFSLVSFRLLLFDSDCFCVVFCFRESIGHAMIKDN